MSKVEYVGQNVAASVLLVLWCMRSNDAGHMRVPISLLHKTIRLNVISARPIIPVLLIQESKDAALAAALR